MSSQLKLGNNLVIINKQKPPFDLKNMVRHLFLELSVPGSPQFS